MMLNTSLRHTSPNCSRGWCLFTVKKSKKPIPEMKTIAHMTHVYAKIEALDRYTRIHGLSRSALTPTLTCRPFERNIRRGRKKRGEEEGERRGRKVTLEPL